MLLPTGLHKTRIAPTPSGFLHLGNLLSFVFTAGLARDQHATILLRIDDLDRDRVRASYVRDIFDTLKFLDIPWQEGPRDYEDYRHNWSQLQRLPHYEKALDYLREQQLVFACNCSRSQLAKIPAGSGYPGTCLHKNLSLDTPGVNWRLKTDTHTLLQVTNHKGHHSVHHLPDGMRHFVVRKKDGFPAYQLSSVVDDSYFGVNLVVRGADLWDSTLAQVYLSHLLPGNRFADAVLVHHPLLVSPDGGKLSKSDGATSVRHHRMNGETPADIFSMIGSHWGVHQRIDNWEELYRRLFFLL